MRRIISGEAISDHASWGLLQPVGFAMTQGFSPS